MAPSTNASTPATARGRSHTGRGISPYWLDATPETAAELCMPLDLTAAELETAARACRAMAYQEGERAKQMENPTMRGPMENAAQRYAALAEKFETARKRA